MIIIARASEVPVPSEGLSVSLMHFPSLFLKLIFKEWPTFEFVQQIMSQNKHIHLKKHECFNEISQEMLAVKIVLKIFFLS